MRIGLRRAFFGFDTEWLWGWSSDVQPNNDYITKFYGLGIEAVFFGVVTAFERRA